MMTIRKLTQEDLEIRVQWMNNPKVYSSMHFDVPILMEKTKDWFKRVTLSDTRHDVCFLLEGQIVAFGGITNIDRTINKAETYLFVNPMSQHSGIGTQAKRLLIDYAFKKLELNKLYVITNEDNNASIALQRKFGYQLEGRLREEYVTTEGDKKDRLYYGLLKADWEQHENIK